MPSPKQATYTAAELPEVLRSSLIAGIVASALEETAQQSGGDYDGRSISEPMAAVLATTAKEIRDWHTAKPRPADLNGGQ